MAKEKILARDILTYPLPAERWPPLLEFWQREWARTDVDWLQALRGAYADSLTIRLALATRAGEIAGTASVYYPRVDPEICCVADVLTRPDLRGQGIAAALTDEAVQLAFAAGCRVAYLGNAPMPHSVYEKIGFRRLRGAIMRRPAPGCDDCENSFYAAGQSATVRETVWGDLPGVACLIAQPLASPVADYSRGLFSIERAVPARCVSAFTTLWNDVAQRGGKMLTLVGQTSHRVLGFGTLTPAPGAPRAHLASIEFATHAHYDGSYPQLIQALLDEGRRRNLLALQAAVMESDPAKIRHLRRAGFRSLAKLPDQVRLDGQALGVSMLSLSL